MRSEPRTFTGWGRFRSSQGTCHVPTGSDELATDALPAASLISRGMGRSYGDAAQHTHGHVIDTTQCDQVAWTDRARGIVTAEAGVSIAQLINRFAPKGWFVPVTPGTRSVTVGGAIAADIHGKNHHLDGSFGDHVHSLRLRLASNEIIDISPQSRPELFWATVGGMGLTGIILDATIALAPIPSTTVRVETHRLLELDDLLDEMRRSDQQHAFSVAWVDLLGGARSVLTQGSFATSTDGPVGNLARPSTPSIGLPRVPIPRVAQTPAVRVFNELWWRKAPAEPTITDESITAFFHPLDAIHDWNRVYGRTGFVQWQCVVPDAALETLRVIIDLLGALPSYFTVLKRFGPANQSPLSFPMTGWTLAVDLPATRRVLAGLDPLDVLVAEAGGRIYLAKDARMKRDVFESMYARLDEFKAIRQKVDPDDRFSSDLSLRLGI